MKRFLERVVVTAGVLGVSAACGDQSLGGFLPSDSGAPAADSGDGVDAAIGSGDDAGNLIGDGDIPDTKPFVCTPDPGNYDIPGNQCDDDADGTVDNIIACDTGLAVDSTDPVAFANALGLCQRATGPTDTKWGLVSATYTQGYAGAGAVNDAQHGLLPKFGDVVKPREGGSLGILSSGFAREYDDADGTPCTQYDGTGCFQTGRFMGVNVPTPIPNGAPPGYPKSLGCLISDRVEDPIGIKLEIKVPNNANGATFDFDFYSGEWPEYVCSIYNDSFVAWVTSKAFPGTKGDFNIALDTLGNPITVNTAFFDRCSPANATVACVGGGNLKAPCTSAASELGGTGFDNPGEHCSGQQSTGGGATGWLTSKTAVSPGEVMTIQFIIWDTRDSGLDSSVLLDRFAWQPVAGQGTTRPPPN